MFLFVFLFPVQKLSKSVTRCLCVCCSFELRSWNRILFGIGQWLIMKKGSQNSRANAENKLLRTWSWSRMLKKWQFGVFRNENEESWDSKLTPFCFSSLFFDEKAVVTSDLSRLTLQGVVLSRRHAVAVVGTLFALTTFLSINLQLEDFSLDLGFWDFNHGFPPNDRFTVTFRSMFHHHGNAGYGTAF